MSEDIRREIYATLDLRETDDLVEMWQENDRVQWTDITFDVLREILEKRLGELPPQNEPVFEYSDEADEEGENGVVVADDNPPVFYQPKEVLWLEKWLHRVAIAGIVITIISGLAEFPQTQEYFRIYMFSNSHFPFISWLAAVAYQVLTTGLQCVLIYFPLKVVAYILKILMEMDFKSRELGVKVPDEACRETPE